MTDIGLVKIDQFDNDWDARPMNDPVWINPAHIVRIRRAGDSFDWNARQKYIIIMIDGVRITTTASPETFGYRMPVDMQEE